MLAHIPVKIGSVLLAKEPQGTSVSIFDKPLLYICTTVDIES